MVKQKISSTFDRWNFILKQAFEDRLNAIAGEGGDLLYGGLKGIEKEALRVGRDGALSMLDHPIGLGSALTNRYITTDFSESLLEFVTPAFRDYVGNIKFHMQYSSIHVFAARRGDAVASQHALPDS